jgi:uncharacterized Tic20 family protein
MGPDSSTISADAISDDEPRPNVKRVVKRFEAFSNRLFRPETREWAAACHFVPLLAYALPVPLFGPAIAFWMWRWKRHLEPGADEEGREALNFHLNVLVWSVVAVLLFVVPVFLVNATAITLGIVAGLRTVQGESFRYPYIVRPVD